MLCNQYRVQQWLQDETQNCTRKVRLLFLTLAMTYRRNYQLRKNQTMLTVLLVLFYIFIKTSSRVKVPSGH